MTDDDPGRRAAADKMRAAGAHEEAIRAFESAYSRLTSGQATMLASSELEPAGDVTRLEDLPEVDAGPSAGADGIDGPPGGRTTGQVLGQVALIKLNGGLATTMGLRQPKSLMEARDGLSFLDIIIGQTLALRRRYDVELPLVLMDSESTREPTIQALDAHPEFDDHGLAPDFLQSVIPKLDADTLEPVAGPTRRQWSGCRRVTATCTARCAARGCSTPCASGGFATR